MTYDLLVYLNNNLGGYFYNSWTSPTPKAYKPTRVGRVILGHFNVSLERVITDIAGLKLKPRI